MPPEPGYDARIVKRLDAVASTMFDCVAMSPGNRRVRFQWYFRGPQYVLMADLLNEEERTTGVAISTSQDVLWRQAAKVVSRAEDVPYIAGELVTELFTKLLEGK